jgi:hypothetical protein
MIDAGVNPAQANAMLAAAVAETPVPAAAAAMPTIEPPPDTTVTLIAGIIDPLAGTMEKEAVVRELNGADEELLSSPNVMRSTAKYLQAIVGRGTLTIGGRKPSNEEYDGLLIGDRELLLMGIRRVTYGDDLELVTQCSHCLHVDPHYVFKLSSVEVRPLQDPADAISGFDVELPSGAVARAVLPRAADQDALLTSDTENPGEINTLMLAKCVQKINGQLLFNEGPLRAMSIRDRRALLLALNDRTPGPRLGEAKRVCNACDKEFDLQIGLLDLFRA